MENAIFILQLINFIMFIGIIIFLMYDILDYKRFKKMKKQNKEKEKEEPSERITNLPDLYIPSFRVGTVDLATNKVTSCIEIYAKNRDEVIEAMDHYNHTLNRKPKAEDIWKNFKIINKKTPEGLAEMTPEMLEFKYFV